MSTYWLISREAHPWTVEAQLARRAEVATAYQLAHAKASAVHADQRAELMASVERSVAELSAEEGTKKGTARRAVTKKLEQLRSEAQTSIQDFDRSAQTAAHAVATKHIEENLPTALNEVQAVEREIERVQTRASAEGRVVPRGLAHRVALQELHGHWISRVADDGIPRPEGEGVVVMHGIPPSWASYWACETPRCGWYGVAQNHRPDWTLRPWCPRCRAAWDVDEGKDGAPPPLMPVSPLTDERLAKAVGGIVLIDGPDVPSGEQPEAKLAPVGWWDYLKSRTFGLLFFG